MIRYTTEGPNTNRILDLTNLTVDEFETLLPAFEAAFVQHMEAWPLEGTPRRGRRYSQYANCCNGKKKQHTLKNVLLVHAALQILFLNHTYAGNVHDKAIADTTPCPAPDGSELVEDLGFLGYDLPGVRHTRPIKKLKGTG
jgi:hypothetical protein